MNSKRLVRVSLIALLLAPIAVTSTPPAIDWYVFDVRGTLLKANGSPANHTVVVLGDCEYGGWQRLSTCDGEGAEAYGPFVSVALTSETGKFALRVSICGSGYPDCDSLAVAVVYPDTTIVGPSFAYDTVRPTKIEATGERSSEEMFSCEEEYTYVDGYIFKYPAVTFPIE